MIRRHLATPMGRDRLHILEVARRSGPERSTLSAPDRETAIRVDLPASAPPRRRYRVGDPFGRVDEVPGVDP